MPAAWGRWPAGLGDAPQDASSRGRSARGPASVLVMRGQGGGAVRLLALVGALAWRADAARAAAEAPLEPTLETHTGPWYRPGAPEVDSLWRPGDPGTPLHLRGRVRTTRGEPLAGALVELWHTDALGNYPPLRASLRAGGDGSFRIRTVLPGHNAGYRARHIHFVVSHPHHRQLVTRIYFRGDPNMDEAPFPELAIVLEQGIVGGQRTLFGDVEFVLSAH